MPRLLSARSHQREPALIRAAVLLLAGLAGAFVGGALLAMAFAAASAAILDTYRIAGFAGGFGGAVLGFTGGAWLVTYQKGKWAGSAVTWLWVTALIIAGCLSYVAFS